MRIAVAEEQRRHCPQDQQLSGQSRLDKAWLEGAELFEACAIANVPYVRRIPTFRSYFALTGKSNASQPSMMCTRSTPASVLRRSNLTLLNTGDGTRRMLTSAAHDARQRRWLMRLAYCMQKCSLATMDRAASPAGSGLRMCVDDSVQSTRKLCLDVRGLLSTRGAAYSLHSSAQMGDELEIGCFEVFWLRCKPGSCL